MPVRRPKSTKNPPIFSHEFVIQNHADIVSCIAMIFVIGLMFQASSPVASLFVALQHNITNGTSEGGEMTLYTNGAKDAFTMFFYLLICIVVHAVVQEYALDKLNRKMHLSKMKHSKFNESGQLLTFYLVSAVWGADIIIRENFVTNISSLWDGYPQEHMLTFLIKFFFILQIAYWGHCFPELYFQKTKKEEIAARIQYASLYLVFVAAAYLLNFTRVALCMLVLHYTVEFLFHLSRLLYFSEKQDLANTGFLIWDGLFVFVRLGTITLAILTFWYGLEKTGHQSSTEVAEGNYNTQLIRISCLSAICLLQAWMMWNFITFHLRRMRERTTAMATRKPVAGGVLKKKEKKTKAKREEDSGEDSSMGDSAPATPTATENGTVRQRGAAAKGKKQ